MNPGFSLSRCDGGPAHGAAGGTRPVGIAQIASKAAANGRRMDLLLAVEYLMMHCEQKNKNNNKNDEDKAL